jgi:D-alanine-D-alanine ligase
LHEPELVVAILTGGPSAEDYLSRRSAKVVFKAFDHSRYDLVILDWQKTGSVTQYRLNSFDEPERTYPTLLHCLTEIKVDVVFNATHGEIENAGRLQGLLNMARLPYTGNGLQSSVIGMDKILSKKVFQSLGIDTPPYVVFQKCGGRDACAASNAAALQSLRFPLIVKPAQGGSSVDIAVVRSKKELYDYVDLLFNDRRRQTVFAEEFISGLDFSVGVLGSAFQGELTPLPVSQIKHEAPFFDADVKYQDTYRVVFDLDIAPELSRQMEDIAVSVHRHFQFEGLSRTDFVVAGDRITTLEVNTHPGLSEYSIVPNMLRRAEIPLSDVLDRLVSWAMRHGKNVETQANSRATS